MLREHVALAFLRYVYARPISFTVVPLADPQTSRRLRSIPSWGVVQIAWATRASEWGQI